MYLDKFGIICQSNGDTGDSAARTGQWFTVVNTFISNPSMPIWRSALANLQPQPGVWVRGTGYPDTKDMSRDQMDPMIVAMGAQKAWTALWDTFENHIKKGFVYQNDDLPLPSTPGLYIRAFGWWWLYPVLLLLDIGFFAVAFECMANPDPNAVDDNNAIVRFVQALKYPTPWSCLARKFYAKTRPKNYGCKSYGGNETNNVMGALVWYHRAASGGNPEVAEAYRSIVMEYFS